MIIPQDMTDLATCLEKETRYVLFFTADWCPDCQFVYPFMPEIEARFPQMTFIRVDRDDYLPLAQKWDVFGIPSFLVIDNGREIGRFVSKNRKTKEEIISFLAGLE